MAAHSQELPTQVPRRRAACALSDPSSAIFRSLLQPEQQACWPWLWGLRPVLRKSLPIPRPPTVSANADVNLSAAQGSIVTAGSHISTPGKLSITANTVAGQTLDNTAGRLAGQQLQIQVGQLNNHQGSIEQSGGADLDINLRGGALNNNAGRIVVNAANLKLQSGALDNTDGLISHAGSGHGALQASSLDNTRGQIFKAAPLEAPVQT